MSAASSSAGRALELLRTRFAGRTDLYLAERQSETRWIKETLTDDVLADHLNGKARVGVAVDRECVAFVVADFDGKRRTAAEALEEARRYAAVVEADAGIDTVTELSRSGLGYHVWILFALEARPTLAEARAFVRAALQVAGLPHEGDESKGHPGIFPHPPGPKDIGRTAYLPWNGLLNGKRAALLVDRADGAPFESQETALEERRPTRRDHLLRATADLVAALEERGESVSPVKLPAATVTTDLLAEPPTGERHGRIRALTLRWAAHGLSIPEVRSLAYMLADRWNMHAEGHRRGEVENLVVGAFDRLRREGKRPGPEPEPLGWTAAGLEDVADPSAGFVQWIAKNLIPSGDTLLLAAPWKSHKTFLAYRAGLDLARGARVFGYFAARGATRVLIVQSEMSHCEDVRRLRRLSIGAGMKPDEVPELVRSGALTFYSRPDIDLATSEGRARFHATVRQANAEVVILDSALGCFGGLDANANTEVHRTVRLAFGPLTAEGRTIILLHHLRKQGTSEARKPDPRSAILGAQAWGAAVGRIYTLERIPDPAAATRESSARLRLALAGAWGPGTETGWVVEIADTADDGTDVRVLPEAEWVRRDEVNAAQRAALAIKQLVEERQVVDRQAAKDEVAAELKLGRTSVLEGLKLAKKRGWVDSRQIEGTCNRMELVPGPNGEATS